jgi:phosphoribosyl-ATP pyrophosphohydrolase/phosphoribosyl-AMP cyclohydrolase
MQDDTINITDIIDWDKVGGLVPVIVQDNESSKVLMMAYMNHEALLLTQSTKFAHYFSRTKKRIWQKGETSGHTQAIHDILVDCDNDTILLKVTQKGGIACHTGRQSCFFTSILDENQEVEEIQKDMSQEYSIIDTLYHTIQERKNQDPDSSYTAKLLQGKENSMLKKITEEAGEFCFAIKDKDEEDIINEGADLTYHVLVALASNDVNPDRIKSELKNRFGISGIEEKNSRTK